VGDPGEMIVLSWQCDDRSEGNDVAPIANVSAADRLNDASLRVEMGLRPTAARSTDRLRPPRGRLEDKVMKIVGTAVIAAALITVAVQSDPEINLQRAAFVDASQASFVVAQAMPGECCNDDFRQALPLVETPIDTQIVKP
jgi:hypothetical protein